MVHVSALALVPVLGNREEIFATGTDAGSGFTGVERLVRSILAEAIVVVGLVVVAVDVKGIAETIASGTSVVTASGDQASGVFAVEEVGEVLGDIKVVADALFGDFVPRAPDDDGRVIAIAVDEVHEVAFMPFLIVIVVVLTLLGILPHVKEFCDDEDAVFVAEFQHFRGWRVVRGADGVHAEVLENLDLAFISTGVDSGAERP